MGKGLSTILDEARMLLLRYGFKSMTMDDVAKGLRVSKKTLYQFVENKEDLVKQVMEYDCSKQRKKVKAVQGEGHDAIRESFEFGRYLISLLGEVHPSIHYDLEKYYPRAWDVFLRFKNEEVVGYVQDNLDRGIEEGLYRKDFDPGVIARIYTYRIDVVFHGGLFPPESYSFTRVYQEMFFYHMLGVVSDKGRDQLYKDWKEGHMNFEVS